MNWPGRDKRGVMLNHLWFFLVFVISQAFSFQIFSQEPSPSQHEAIITSPTDETLGRDEQLEFDEFHEDIVEDVQKSRPVPAYKKIPIPKDIENKKLSETIPFILGPLKLQSDDELKRLIQDRFKVDSPVRKIFDKEPRLYQYVIALIRHDTALQKLISISENLEKLKNALWMMLGTMLFAFVLKKIIHHDSQPFLTAMLYTLFRFTFMSFLRIFILWYYFREELAPSLSLLKKTFF